MKPTSKHYQWFRTGAATLRALLRAQGRDDVLPTNDDWYLCPICLDGFTMDELTVSKELSIEHVPPEGLGGRDLVLTCRKCNNSQGSAFDMHAHAQQKVGLFLSGEAGAPEGAKIEFGDVTINGEMYINGKSGILFTAIPSRSNPADVKRMDELSERREVPPGFRGFTFTPHLSYLPDRARISWIRTAYLAAFALFGWSFIWVWLSWSDHAACGMKPLL